MRYEDIVNNVNIFGLEQSVTEQTETGEEVTERTLEPAGKGRKDERFMNGIIVQFDLTFSNKAWVQAERYHFLDFVSSQSTMQKITKFDLDDAYIEYTDPRIIEIMKEKTKAYNELTEDIRKLKEEGKDTTTLNDLAKVRYLEILYSNPAGFRMTARMTTNYRQLKTIYHQRKSHRLPEWRAFCEWIETLPNSEFITYSE